MYHSSASGLSPEAIAFPGNTDVSYIYNAKYYILRPGASTYALLFSQDVVEAVETLFVLWRTTHDSIYREWAWDIFQVTATDSS